MVAGNSMTDKRESRERLNTCRVTIPNIATANRPAAREMALFIPDAIPTRFSGTAFMTVVVSGATLTAMPKPSTTVAEEEPFINYGRGGVGATLVVVRSRIMVLPRDSSTRPWEACPNSSRMNLPSVSFVGP